MTAHLDIDALAGVLAGEGRPAHLLDCPACRAALDEMGQATEVVRRQLAALPPVPAPGGIFTLSEAQAQGQTTTTLPTSPVARRWRPLAVAAAAVLAAGGTAVGLTASLQRAGNSTSSSAAGPSLARPLPPGAGLLRVTSGHDYTGRAALVAALPEILGADRPHAAAAAPGQAATGPAGADPLARLRTSAGLADCLVALLPAQDPRIRPLAVDYARYRGAPALVVVLSTSRQAKLDVYVVGPGCSRADDSTQLYTSVYRP